MEAQNTFSHLGVYSTALVRSVGSFREGFEGSQDHDLVLRCSEHCAVSRSCIFRACSTTGGCIPKARRGAQAKPYTVQAAERAITEHLQRQQLPLQAMRWSPLRFRAELALPEPAPRVSVIIPTRNGLSVLEPCLNSLLRITRYSDLEVLVVDNGSDDPATLRFWQSLSSEARSACSAIPARSATQRSTIKPWSKPRASWSVFSITTLR